MVKLSIIIPTLNEENYLPKLLTSIKSQNFKDYEIIVSDGKSKDKTRQVAKKFKCKIVEGIGLPGIGRNKGAKIARGNLLLFLDADVILPAVFLPTILKEFESRKLDIAFCKSTPLSNKLLDKLVITAYNIFASVFQYIKPFGSGYCILVKNSAHKKLSGFREDIVYLEDVDYIQRAIKFAKFGILKPKVFLSMRRFEKEGRWRIFTRYVNTYIYRILGKEPTGKIAKEKKFYYTFDYKKS